MKTRGWFGVGAGVLVLAAVAAAAMYVMAGRAFYQPGAARAALTATPAPATTPGAASGSGFWQVTRTVALKHFDAGTGTDVLVVHGGPGVPPVQPWSATSLTGDRIHWIFYQQRGCGASTRPFDHAPIGNMYAQMKAVEGALGIGQQVADIERIRRLLGQEKLILLGHSFGALTAVLYAAEFPDHVRALVLVSPADLVVMPGRSPDLYQSIDLRLPATMKGEFADYRRRIFDFRAQFGQDERSLAALYGGFMKYYLAAVGSAAPAGAAPAAAPAGTARARGQSDPAPAAGAPAWPQGIGPTSQLALRDGALGGWVVLAQYLSLGRRHDWSDAARRVRVPVLVIHGERDLLSEAGSREVAGYFPGARFVVIPGAGHFAFDEQPRAFAEAVEGFVTGL
jgi:proline iminopeptidase